MLHTARLSMGTDGSWRRRSPASDLAWLAVLLVACFGAAGLGGVLTSTALVDWYPAIAKPTWTPPNAVFGPVWTVLYFLMGLSAWLATRHRSWREVRAPLAWFTWQLLLNAAWSGLFFGLHSPGAALVEIGLLWLAIAATAWSFWSRSSLAAALLLPYLAWSTFAAGLNFAIWNLNK